MKCIYYRSMTKPSSQHSATLSLPLIFCGFRRLHKYKYLPYIRVKYKNININIRKSKGTACNQYHSALQSCLVTGTALTSSHPGKRLGFYSQINQKTLQSYVLAFLAHTTMGGQLFTLNNPCILSHLWSVNYCKKQSSSEAAFIRHKPIQILLIAGRFSTQDGLNHHQPSLTFLSSFSYSILSAPISPDFPLRAFPQLILPPVPCVFSNCSESDSVSFSACALPHQQCQAQAPIAAQLVPAGSCWVPLEVLAAHRAGWL